MGGGRVNGAAGWLRGVCLAFAPFPVTSPTSQMWQALFQLLPWLWFPEWVGLCMFWALLRNQQFLLSPQHPLDLQPEVMRLSFPSAGTLAAPTGLGLGSLSHKVSPWFLPTYSTDYLRPLPSPAHCHHTVSSSFVLPISTPPAHLDEYTFFKSLVLQLWVFFWVIFWPFCMFFIFKLVVFLLMVAQWGEACLPMSLTWPEALCYLFNVLLKDKLRHIEIFKSLFEQNSIEFVQQSI